MKKRNVFLAIVLIFVAILLLAFIIWYLSRPQPLMLQGEAVARSYKVSSKLTGRVDSLTVEVGDVLKKGDFVFAMSTPEVDAKLVQAEAMLSAADARDRMVNRGLRPQEIEAAFNMWQKAEAGLKLAEVTYRRIKNLYDEGVVPSQNLDEAQANLTAMQNTALAAKAQYIMAKDGARYEDKRAAAALVEQAAGGVEEVKSFLSDAWQYAPVNGEVSSVIAEAGELVGAGYPVVTMIDTDDIWLSFNIKETLLPKIRKDMVLKVYVPALDRSLDVKVTYISVQADYATWSATRSSGDFDIRTFEVRMYPLTREEGLRPGMTALLNWSELPE